MPDRTTIRREKPGPENAVAIETAQAWQAATAERMSQLGRDFTECRPLLCALGDENRQLIFMALLDNYDGLRVTELAEMVGLSRPAVSHHLKILKDAGVVDAYRSGTKNFYHPSPQMECWSRLARLTRGAESLVRAVAERGVGCPRRS